MRQSQPATCQADGADAPAHRRPHGCNPSYQDKRTIKGARTHTFTQPLSHTPTFYPSRHKHEHTDTKTHRRAPAHRHTHTHAHTCTRTCRHTHAREQGLPSPRRGLEAFAMSDFYNLYPKRSPSKIASGKEIWTHLQGSYASDSLVGILQIPKRPWVVGGTSERLHSVFIASRPSAGGEKDEISPLRGVQDDPGVSSNSTNGCNRKCEITDSGVKVYRG